MSEIDNLFNEIEKISNDHFKRVRAQTIGILLGSISGSIMAFCIFKILWG